MIFVDSNRKSKVIIFLFVALCVIKFSFNCQCIDESGEVVDWLILYKLPRYGGVFSPDPVEDGERYMYFTSDNSQMSWIMSNLSIKDVNSIPGRILSPIYGENSSVFHMFYNDEHPDGTVSSTKGHTKGAVVFNEHKGYWLIHSVPKFPPDTGQKLYDYPRSGQVYGQTFLCVSLSTKATADMIGSQLLLNNPSIYSYNLPNWVGESYPSLTKAVQGKHETKLPYFNTVTFSSLSGANFTSFAKNVNFGKDLYTDLVAPTLKADLMVETWPNGRGKMNSSCDGLFKVLNINAIDFNAAGAHFVRTKDHAKWTVSFSFKEKYVCIGDINRMEGQKKRGGGTVCLQDNFAWNAFKMIIKEVETCPINIPNSTQESKSKKIHARMRDLHGEVG